MKDKPEKTIKKSVLLGLLIFFVLALFLGVFIFFVVRNNMKLTDSLQETDMELTLKSFVYDEREKRTVALETAAEDEYEQRLSLTNAMIKKDKSEVLMLVNPWNSLPEDYEARVIPIGDDLLFDERGAGALEAFLEACKAEGWAPCPLSTYRTQEYQEGLFQDKMERLIAGGEATTETAYDLAAQEVAVPGTSEHQTGFAADIVDEYYPELDYTQAYSSTQQWMMDHCYEYGFILRFPDGEQDITGIIYEPWHYRYVGKTVAKEIQEKGITFEEYCEKYLKE